jgi:hypothetical protein
LFIRSISFLPVIWNILTDFINIISVINTLALTQNSDYRSRGPGFDSRRYNFSGEVVGLEGAPLSLVSITEELLGWKSSGSGSRK